MPVSTHFLLHVSHPAGLLSLYIVLLLYLHHLFSLHTRSCWDRGEGNTFNLKSSRLNEEAPSTGEERRGKKIIQLQHYCKGGRRNGSRK